jgi:hypothetical protein
VSGRKDLSLPSFRFLCGAKSSPQGDEKRAAAEVKLMETLNEKFSVDAASTAWFRIMLTTFKDSVFIGVKQSVPAKE